MRIKLPEFATKSELFTYLKENKKELIAEKKSMPIKADPVYFGTTKINSRGLNAVKNNEPVKGDLDTLRVKVVANTANWIDSHMDVLIADSAKKSISERKRFIPHLHDHIHRLDAKIGKVHDIILQEMSYSELGVEGSDVMKSMNEKIFNQYKNGEINQHSIGLQYLDIELAINDEESEKEFDFWNKYYPQIINKEVADEMGFFWVVKEIRLLENSAVLFGSNELTPTLENDVEKSIEPLQDTQEKKPEESTSIDYEFLINNFKL